MSDLTALKSRASRFKINSYCCLIFYCFLIQFDLGENGRRYCRRYWFTKSDRRGAKIAVDANDELNNENMDLTTKVEEKELEIETLYKELLTLKRSLKTEKTQNVIKNKNTEESNEDNTIAETKSTKCTETSVRNYKSTVAAKSTKSTKRAGQAKAPVQKEQEKTPIRGVKNQAAFTKVPFEPYQNKAKEQKSALSSKNFSANKSTPIKSPVKSPEQRVPLYSELREIMPIDTQHQPDVAKSDVTIEIDTLNPVSSCIELLKQIEFEQRTELDKSPQVKLSKTSQASDETDRKLENQLENLRKLETSVILNAKEARSEK